MSRFYLYSSDPTLGKERAALGKAAFGKNIHLAVLGETQGQSQAGGTATYDQHITLMLRLLFHRFTGINSGID